MAMLITSASSLKTYGVACANDFVGNWFGGQAVSLQVNYTHAEQFAAAGYEPFVVDGTEYGEVRQYGNCKFLR
jgi:hypothetical protein